MTIGASAGGGQMSPRMNGFPGGMRTPLLSRAPLGPVGSDHCSLRPHVGHRTSFRVDFDLDRDTSDDPAAWVASEQVDDTLGARPGIPGHDNDERCVTATG